MNRLRFKDIEYLSIVVPYAFQLLPFDILFPVTWHHGLQNFVMKISPLIYIFLLFPNTIVFFSRNQ